MTLPPSSWQGSLSLKFERCGNKTILRREAVQAPLKVQRPFYPESEAICHSVMLHTAGGVVGGDRLNVQVQVDPDAQALVTTAAATKIYRSNGLEAKQTTQVRVGANACLEWLPQETIVFDGALYRQQLRVELEPMATWIGWDITRLGRSARGERFVSGIWRSRTEVWQNQRLVWVDPQVIRGGSEMIDSLHGLAGAAVIGSFVLIGQPIDEALLAKVRSLPLPAGSDRLPGSCGLTTGMTRLTQGLLCRYRGDSSAAARQWFVEIWHLLRQECLGQSGCIPRVWQL